MYDELRELAGTKLETRFDDGSDKVMPLAEAVRRFVRPGMMIHLGNISGRSMATNYELLRQYRGQKPNFDIVTGTSNAIVGGAAMIRSGLFRKIITSYLGAPYPSPMASKVTQAAFADKLIEFEHWSLLTITLRLKAAALGVPFLPTRSLIGSDMARENPHAFHVVDDPFIPGEQIGLVSALHPDISFVHGLCADRNGNTIIAPPHGDNIWGAMGAREGAIVTVERIVPTETIRKISHLGRLPAYFVRSVTEVPFGAHPTAVNNQWIQGIDGYPEDYDFQLEARKADRTVEAIDEWMEKWVYSVKDHQDYLAKLGYQRLHFLKGKAHWDSYIQELEGCLPEINPGPEYNGLEHMVAVSARILAERLKSKNLKTILAGVGTSNLSAWMANAMLKDEGVDVDLMAEVGFYGYTPRPGDPFIFNFRNIASCKGLYDNEQVLGIFVSGTQARCLGSLGAAQVDKFGNINTTFIPPKLVLVGSGGGNDVASNACDVVVTAVQGRSRFVDQVPYITSPGKKVSALVSNLGVFEKLGDDLEFTLTGYLDRPEVGETAEDAVRNIQENCGWQVKVAPKLVAHGAPTVEELRMMRLYDPHRQFLGE